MSLCETLSRKLVNVACLIGAVCSPVWAGAQTLTYNSSWGFQTPSDRATKMSRVDLELRKKGGFYDSFETNILYDGNTFVTYDCVGSNSEARANESVNSQSSQTSSPSTGADLDVSTSALGNASDALVTSKAKSTNTQDASGAISSDTSLNLKNNTGVLNAGGGKSEQTTSLVQQNEGTVTSSAEGGVGCNFFTPRPDSVSVGQKE